MYDRRPGSPFDDVRVERYAASRGHGKSIRVSAEAAGVGLDMAKTWEKAPAVRERIREFGQGQQVAITVSSAWVVEQLKANAERAQQDGKYKDSTDALELLYKIIKTDPEVMQGVASNLPAAPKLSREELRKQLSAAAGSHTLNSITAEGVEVPA
jgi:hypothetical protein